MTEPAAVPSPSPSNAAPSRLLRRLRVAAILMVLGLLVETVTLRSVHPFAFLSFAFFGMTLVGLAVLLYLYAIVSD
jgi:hypothetical protein